MTQDDEPFPQFAYESGRSSRDAEVEALRRTLIWLRNHYEAQHPEVDRAKVIARVDKIAPPIGAPDYSDVPLWDANPFAKKGTPTPGVERIACGGAAPPVYATQRPQEQEQDYTTATGRDLDAMLGALLRRGRSDHSIRQLIAELRFLKVRNG